MNKQMGTPTPSVSAQIADVQRLIEKSGVKYTMHSAGTTLGMYSVNRVIREPSPADRFLEGSWDKVYRVIGQAHTMLHQQGILRIQTDIRSGSR